MNVMKLARPILMGAFACLFAIFSHAQTKTVTGKVTDSKDGSPLVGASVVAKGTKTGTQTGADGSFKLTVPANVTTLVISSIGFGTKEVSVNSAADVSLTASADALSEVVVVGYGSRKAKDVTGSVAKISEKDFNKGQIATPDQLLQGRTPGVLVTPSSGEPGAAATINIRGTSSISGSQEPLYVIDGVPLIQGGTIGTNGPGPNALVSGVEGGSSARNPLAFLNPADIESMTVLKDASAAAIYGSRGANGVILITTKSGKGGKKGSFNFGANTSVAGTANRYDLLDAQDFLTRAKAANIAGGADPAAAAVAVQALDKGANTDWQDVIFRTAISQNYNASYGYNYKGTSLRLSGSFDDQQGIVKNSSLKRATGRMNFSQKFLKDKAKFDLNLTYSNTRNEFPPISNNAGFQGSLLGAALAFNPTIPIYTPTGAFTDFGDGNRNPAQMLAYFNSNERINRLLGSIGLSYQITKDLSYRGVLGWDNAESVRQNFADPRLGSGAYGGTTNIFGRDLQNQIFGNGRASRELLKTRSLLIEHYLTYDKTFGKHNINAVAGYSYQDFQVDYSGSVGWGLNTPVVNPTDVFVRKFGGFKNYAQLVPNFDRNELQSVFGRVNYTYADKYYLTATVRTDGSSKFGANNRYGTFPAFAFKWKVLQEGWAAKSFLGKWFSDFAVRANYGKLGSQDNLAAYAALNLQQTFNPGNGTATRFIQQGNPDLKWETVTTNGFGVDFTTLDRRLNVTVDYYNAVRKDMLFFAPTPGGFSPQANWWINLPGEVTNKGWEFNVNYKIIEKKDFQWDASFNATTVRNNITGLPSPINTGSVSGQGLTGAFAQTLTNNNPIFTWSMPQFLGFDGNGNARYAAGASNQLVGTALPSFFGGLTNNFNYRRWSLSIFANWSSGFYVYNNTANALFLQGALRNGRNVTRDVAFSPENPFNPGSVSTRFLEKGDFIRLSNVNLSYAFNVKSKYVRTITAFVSGQNLALWTKYSGIDPEVNVDKNINGIPSRGFEYTNFPRPRIVTFGVNIGF
jgi:TonB-dependent starch-binding outer membrane protein SusC